MKTEFYPTFRPVVQFIVMAYLVRSFIAAVFILFFVGDAKAQNNTDKKKQVSSVDVNRSKSQVVVTYTDGTSETMSEQEANKKGIVNNGGYANYKDSAYHRKPGQTVNLQNSKVKPMVVLDGKEVSHDTLSKIKPDEIESVNLLKDKTATAKYGVKGKNGVVEIITKQPATKFKND